MPPLRIALLQLQAAGNQPANLRRGLAGCQDARALGADIALFPEDLVITCINGGFNNLSAWEAAQLVSREAKGHELAHGSPFVFSAT